MTNPTTTVSLSDDEIRALDQDVQSTSHQTMNATNYVQVQVCDHCHKPLYIVEGSPRVTAWEDGNVRNYHFKCYEPVSPDPKDTAALDDLLNAFAATWESAFPFNSVQYEDQTRKRVEKRASIHAHVAGLVQAAEIAGAVIEQRRLVALLKKIGPVPWQNTEIAFAQARLISEFEEALAFTPPPATTRHA